MRTSALILLLVAVTADAKPRPRFERFCSRTTQGRSDRGLQCDDGPFFGAFGLDGVGTFGACSSTPPTGVKGEALSYAGAGPKTCTKGVNGLRGTLIADGDLLSLTALPRVELDADGVAGLLVEATADTINIQSRPLCNAAYSDVGTPACVANFSPGPWGTATMARFTDNDAVAKEGRSQTVASTSATRFTAFCHVKADTATSATIILAGTGSVTGDCTATITGLSSSTSSIIECTSAVAYAGTLTAVTASILVGAAVGDQGNLFVEGCDVKPNAAYRTSFGDTGAVAVTRAAEMASFTLGTAIGPSVSFASSIAWPSSSVGAVNFAAFGAGDNLTLYRTSDTAAGYQINGTITAPAVSSMGVAVHRAALEDNAGVRSAFWDGSSVAAPAASMAASQTVVWVGTGVSGGVPSNGINTRLCLDLPGRCR